MSRDLEAWQCCLSLGHEFLFRCDIKQPILSRGPAVGHNSLDLWFSGLG